MKIHWFTGCNEDRYFKTLGELDTAVVELKMKLKILTQRNEELYNQLNDLRKENKGLEARLAECNKADIITTPAAKICKTVPRKNRGLLAN